MSKRNYLKKLGKRLAGTWGRINHKRDMRAESKGLRQQAKEEIKDEVDLRVKLSDVIDKKDLDLWLEIDSVKDLDLLNDEEPH